MGTLHKCGLCAGLFGALFKVGLRDVGCSEVASAPGVAGSQEGLEEREQEEAGVRTHGPLQAGQTYCSRQIGHAGHIK